MASRHAVSFKGGVGYTGCMDFPLPQFALDCDAADDIPGALKQLRETHGTLGENIRIQCWRQALETHPLPIKCLDALHRAGMTPAQWIHQMGSLNSVDWTAALAWWAKGGQKDRLNDISEAADYALWQAQEFADENNSHSYMGLAGAVLDTLAQYSYSEHDFLSRCGCQTPGSGSTLMLMAALAPDNTWMARSGLDPLHLIWEGLHHQVLAGELLYERPGGSLMERWRKADPSHEVAWQQARAIHQRDNQDMEQWMARWMPDNTWKGSPLETWAMAPTMEKGSEHPLAHLMPAGLMDKTSPQKIAAMLELHFAVEAPTYLRWNALNTIAERLWGRVNRLQPDYMPGTTGLALHPTRQDVRLDKWLEDQARTPEGREDIRSILDSAVGEAGAGKLTPLQLLEWIELDPQWEQWRDRKGRSLLELWIQEPKNRASGKFLRDITLLAPGWLTDPTPQGDSLVERIGMPESLRAEIKQTLLLRAAKKTVTAAKPRLF